MLVSFIRLGRVAGMLTLLLLARPVSAQSVADAAAPGSAGLRRIAVACKTETVRFCPAQREYTAPHPREQLICLRPYRTSLSLGCRGAINAMTSR